MCLAVPAEIVSRAGDDGWVLLGDSKLRVNLLCTPEAAVGDWVLVHAGFAIQSIDAEAARKTWDVIASIPPGEGERKGVRSAEGKGEGR